MYLINPKRRRKKSRSSKPVRRASRRRVTRRRKASPVATKARRTIRRRSRRGIRRARRSTKRIFKMRGGRSISLTVRNPRRRSGGMMGLGNIGSEFRALFSKDNLTVAGGAVAATVLTQYLLNSKKSDNKPLLPLPQGEEGRKAAIVAYSLAIPFAGAIAVRKMNPGLSKGMLLGGLVNSIIAAWQQYAKDSYGKVTGTAMYLDGTSEYLDSVGRTAAGYMPTNTVDTTFEPGFSRSAF